MASTLRRIRVKKLMEKKQENAVELKQKESNGKTPRAPDGYKKEWNNTAKKVEYIKEDDDCWTCNAYCRPSS